MNTNEFFELLVRYLEAGRSICYAICGNQKLQVKISEFSSELEQIQLEVENNLSFLEDLLEDIKNKKLHFSLVPCTGSYGPDSITLFIYKDIEHAAIIDFYDNEAYRWAYKVETKEM